MLAMALIYLHLAITVMLFSYCLSNLDTEPKCSKFDFQEKLLEKMVRMEQSSELLKAELAIARGEIQKTKTELAELKGTLWKQFDKGSEEDPIIF